MNTFAKQARMLDVQTFFNIASKKVLITESLLGDTIKGVRVVGNGTIDENNPRRSFYNTNAWTAHHEELAFEAYEAAIAVGATEIDAKYLNGLTFSVFDGKATYANGDLIQVTISDYTNKDGVAVLQLSDVKLQRVEAVKAGSARFARKPVAQTASAGLTPSAEFADEATTEADALASIFGEDTATEE